MMCAYSCVSGAGLRRRCKPTSSGKRFDLRQLHFLQAITTFSQRSAEPPRDTGTTWSTVNSAAEPTWPQYWQVWSSRSRRLRRLGRSRRRGTWMVRSNRTMTTPSGSRRPARASAAACSAASSRNGTRSLVRRTMRRRWLITLSGCIDALSSSTAMAAFYWMSLLALDWSCGHRAIADHRQRAGAVAGRDVNRSLGSGKGETPGGRDVRLRPGALVVVEREREPAMAGHCDGAERGRAGRQRHRLWRGAAFRLHRRGQCAAGGIEHEHRRIAIDCAGAGRAPHLELRVDGAGGALLVAELHLQPRRRAPTGCRGRGARRWCRARTGTGADAGARTRAPAGDGRTARSK